MKIESVISIINHACDDERYTRARELMVQEWTRLIEMKNYKSLNDNAKQLIKIIREEKEKGVFEELTYRDKKLLKLLNDSVRDVNLSFARRVYFSHMELFDKQEAQGWLTTDAQFMCMAWKKHNVPEEPAGL
ncbi:hypothetical protein V1498_20340 [Peribacillus sp. SCS-26]|uniref:hypothetical protein n=1 Tax=Paraperibacillus marinus TaxID=3115295 RepID=UPI003905D817